MTPLSDSFLWLSSLKLHQPFRNSIILFLHEELSKTLSGLFGISWKVLQISAHRHAQTSKKADRRHWHVTVKGPGVPVPMSVKREWIVRAGRLLLVEPVTVWQGTAGETEFYNLGANRVEGERGNPARGQTWHRRAVEEQAFQARRPLNCLQFFYCYCQRFPGCHLRLSTENPLKITHFYFHKIPVHENFSKSREFISHIIWKKNLHLKLEYIKLGKIYVAFFDRHQ